MRNFKSFLTSAFLFFLIINNQLIANLTNTLPSAVITYPHSNAYYQEGSNVTINVYSTDIGGTFANGTIEKVEFFINGELVFQTPTHKNNTYTFVWNNVQVGQYRITARATDNSGDSFTSAGVLLHVGKNPVIKKGLSAGKGKYLANILASSTVRSDFLTFWNGVTAENAHKWGSIENVRNVMTWTTGDNIYNYARNNHLIFRYHTIAWGSQYPRWLETLGPADFQAEIEHYMSEIAKRYPYMDQVEVLNENLYKNTWNGQEHAAGTPFFRAGLGGPGETGYDWVIWLFEKARYYFPNSKLVMNDFELENNPNGIREMLDVIKVLRDRGLIDGFGTQAHTFNVDVMWNQTATLKQRIDLMASSGVPVYVTELDLKGQPASEENQLRAYRNIFPVFWGHPAVAGITLWGYVDGAIWQANAGLLRSNGTKKPAMEWLEEYMKGLPDVGYPFQGVEIVNDGNMISNGQFDLTTTGWNIQNNSGATSSMEVVTGAGMSGPRALRICPENVGTASWHIQLRQQTPIVSQKKYSIAFLAKADVNRTIDVAIQQDADSYTTHFQQRVNLTNEPQEFSFEFTAPVTDQVAALKFYIGDIAGCVYIDNVRMYNLTDTSSDNTFPNEQNKIIVYPNPFNDNLTIDSKFALNGARYQLMSLYGQVLKEGNFDRTKTIETLDLPVGLYILRIDDDKRTELLKLMKR